MGIELVSSNAIIYGNKTGCLRLFKWSQGSHVDVSSGKTTGEEAVGCRCGWKLVV